MKRVFRILLGAAVAAPVCLALFAMAFGNRLVFLPSPYDPAEAGVRSFSTVPIEDVEILAEDGTRLHAWWMRPQEAKAAILFLHGNAGSVANRIGYLLALQKIPAAVLVLDYRGYGRSEGSPSEAGVCEDARASYRWLRGQGWASSSIFLYGESLGGAVAIDLAGREPVAGIIVQTTFTSIGDMAKQVIPWIPLGWAIGPKFASIDKVGEIRVPKLHFHGRNDEIVPYGLGRRLFDAASQPKRWVEYPDMRHNEWPGAREKDWLFEIRAFIEESLK